MKCPDCLTNHGRKFGMTCRCGYTFLLEPHVRPRVSDNLFHSAMRLASGRNTLHYTETQLYSALCQLKDKKGRKTRRDGYLTYGIIFVLALIVIALDRSLFQHLPLFFLFFLVLSLLTGIICLSSRSLPSYPDFCKILSKWRQHDRPLPGLITTRALSKAPPPWQEEDIHAYGVQKVLFCDREELVDLLVLNGFHTSNGCLIVTPAGYPEHLQSETRRALTSEPPCHLFLLHDGIPSFAEKALSQLPADCSAKVLDLGLAAKSTRRAPWLGRLSQKGAPLRPDLLLYPRLSSLLTCAMNEWLTLQALENQQQRQSYRETNGTNLVLILEEERWTLDWSHGGDDEGDGE
ncbi:hypothetical protein [Roseibacillus ishigakijimensis]|uniref:Uncharacterized protein n=1 Tax=Roseibacillus ishigakijimensis TaxID=454146 RepID=A0A934RP34_9BACT|nr:hypothetical protein [Roseibacillus ishigakijimensis]MBK1835372.1 hypothetical protein [Roseibacillus ishigakijimensis]